jgi:hypothetical protein
MKGDGVSLDCDTLHDGFRFRRDVLVDQKKRGVSAGLG